MTTKERIVNHLTRKGFVLGLSLLLFGCPQGTKTAVDFTVKVGADTCKEDRAAEPVENEFVTLDCANVSGEGTVRIRFPRRAWWNIQTRDIGNTPTVPGK